MLSVVTFRWQTPGYRSTFTPETVLVLRDMVARHYPDPHRFLCVTDDPAGLEDVETIPIWDDYATMPHPTSDKHPSCYRRLKTFAPEMRQLFGERFVCLDLDCVIVGDLRPLWDRSEAFVGLAGTQPPTTFNGSMVLMTAGSRAHVWDLFRDNPEHARRLAKRAGHYGSDQAWISYVLGDQEARWTPQDGVYTYRLHVATNGNRLPQDARIVFFAGKRDPWSPELIGLPWIQEHWTRGALHA